MIGAMDAMLVLGVLFVLWALPPAVQARMRGYRFLPWLAAATLGNSILLLVILGVLPDRAGRTRRERLRQRLQEKLAAGKAPPVEAIPAAGRLERSLGELATELPARSLGDDETRL